MATFAIICIAMRLAILEEYLGGMFAQPVCYTGRVLEMWMRLMVIARVGARSKCGEVVCLGIEGHVDFVNVVVDVIGR
jgi:hypothetical protein